MNDNDIIKALEHCISNNGSCDACPAFPHIAAIECLECVIRLALDLINRQKAEIERLYKSLGLTQQEQYINGRNDGIKEFAEKLKGRTTKALVFGHEYNIATTFGIDALVKEMTEEQK